MNEPVIKYLSPTTGKYEYATVKGLGDLTLLQTQVKTDIVSVINELIREGVSGGGMTDDEREKLQNIENTVGSLKDGTFIIKEWTSVDDYYQAKLNETIDIINRANKETIELEKEQIIAIIEEATSDYQESVTNMSAILDSARDNVSNAEKLLIDKAAQLEMANIDYTELSQTVDTINGVIEDKVQSIDFDLFNAMTSDYQTLVTQTANKWGVEASHDSLSYMSGRVEANQAEIDVQGGLIRSKVGYDEWQYLPVNIGEYNDNLLPYTRDLSGPWTRSNSAIYVSSDTFQHTKVVAIEQNGSYYSIDDYDDLEVGTTYTASIWVNIQDLDKDASEAKYEPNNTIQDVKVMIGSQLHSTEIYEDLRGINGWAHHQVQFVADSVNPVFSPRIGFNHNTQIAYMTAPKLELGDKVTGWQPHVDDDYATIYSSRSLIRQQGNEIATFVGKVEVLDDSYREATSSFSQIAEGFELSTQAIEDYEQAVLLYGAEVQAFNTSFSAKVWEQDFANAIEGINIDTRNRVYNSTFDITRYNEETREMEIPYWDGNDGSVVKLDGENDEKESFLKLSRAGLTNVNITSMTSNKFKTRNGERLIFSFNANHANLDNDSVFAIEVLDIRDVRLRKIEFALSELSQEPLSNGIIRYTGAYTVSHEDVAKARVMIQLPKNGTLHVNKVLVQAADIARTDWTPAPEDSQLVRSIQEAELVILKDEISQRVKTQDIDQTTGLVINQEGKLTISPQSIISTVSNVELLGDVALINGTQFEQRVDGWRQKLVDDGTVINDINASPGLYQINFDRVAIDGELLAKKISAYSLDVADGFRLVNGPVPIIEANSDGEITLNIQKLKINALSDIVTPDGSAPASKQDLEEIELMPGPNGETSYLHRAYANITENNFVEKELLVGVSELQDDGYMVSMIITGDSESVVVSTDAPRSSSRVNYYVMSFAQIVNGEVHNPQASEIHSGKTMTFNENPKILYLYTKARTGEDGVNDASYEDIIDSKYFVNAREYNQQRFNYDRFSKTDSNRTHMGTEVNFVSKGSDNPEDYDWTRVLGGTGQDGSTARLMALSSESQTFRELADGTLDRSTIKVSSHLQNFDSSNVKWEVSIDGGAFSLSSPVLKNKNNKSVDVDLTYGKPNTIIVRGTATHYDLLTPIEYVDQVTISRLKDAVDGEDALSAFLTNESIIIPASSSGKVGSLENASGTFKLYEGTTDVTLQATFIVKSQVGAATSISNTGVYNVASLTADSARVVLEATYKGTRVEKVLILAKSKEGVKGLDGAAGDKGDDGENALSAILTNESISLPANSSGVVSSYAGANGAMEIYDGASKVTSGVVYSLTNPSDIAVTIDTFTGEYVVTGMTNGTSVRVGSINISATYNGKTISKRLSVSKSLDGVAGSDGTPGDSAKLIKLTASSQIFSKSKTGAISPNLITVTGTSQNVTISTWQYSVDGGAFTATLPAGASRNGNTVTLKGISVKARTIAIKAFNTGVEDVVTITRVEDGSDGAKGDTGSKGTDGIAGKDGIGVRSTAIAYSSSGSGTVIPVAGWQVNVPTVTAGNYLWTRTVWTYTDNTTETGYTVSRIGKDGNTGTDGIAGKDGVGISNTVINYASSTSGTVRPTTGWTAGVPSVAQGNYLWTRTVWTYTDSTSETGYSAARMGEDGSSATARNYLLDSKPKSVIHTSAYNIADFTLAETPVVGETYSLTLKGELAPTKTRFAIYNSGGQAHLGGLVSKGNGVYTLSFVWTNAIPTGQVVPTYISIYVMSSSQAGASKIEWVTMVKGSVPLTEWVPAHEDIQSQINKSVKTTDVEYYLSTSSTGLAGGKWQTTAPAWVNGRHMWSRTKVVLNDGTTSYNPSATGTNITGASGATGATGGTGAAGRGISSIVEQFYLSDSKTTQTGGSWSTTMPTWSVGKYVWTRSLITYTTGTPATSTTEPLVSSEWEAINELEIGGVNLLRKDNWGAYSAYNTIPIQEGNIITFKKNNANASIAISNRNLPYGPDVVYTYSGIVKFNGVPVTNATWGAYKGVDTYQPAPLSFNIDDATGKFIITQRKTNDSSWLLHGGFFQQPLGTIITIENFQVEKGNKATDWSPAPEDVQEHAEKLVNDIEFGGRNLLIRHNEIKGRGLAGAGSNPGTTTSIYPNPGAIADASTMNGLISVNPGEAFIFSKSGNGHWRYNWLNSSYAFISRDTPTERIHKTTAPDGAKFLWVSYPTNEEVKIEKGTKPTSWTASPEDIEASYTAVAQAKAEAERVKAEAYADGKVTAEEKLRIKDVNDKLSAAKQYAEDQILADKTIKDTRNDNQTPAWYYTNHKRQTIKEFKLTSTIGVVSSEGTYGILETEIPWTDSSGGPVKQTFRVNSKTFKRSGTTTSWSRWVSYDDIAETAKSDAATAKGIADGAASSASTANNLLADIASDSKLTPTEKKATKKEWDIIVGEKPKIDISANTYGITTQKTAYNTAYNALNTYLSSLLANLNTTSNIVGTTFRNNFKNYYNARQDLLNAISNGAKALVDGMEIGGTNLLKNSRTIRLSSNNNATYPASITAMEESGRSFSRVRRTNLALQPSVFSIYSTIDIEDINKSIFENESTVISFKARASQNVTMSTMDSTFDGSPIVTGTLGNINITTEWKTFYSIFPKIPKSASGFRANPLNTITSVNMSTFYLDLCEWKIEKGNKPTDWSPSPEDVQRDIGEKADGALTNQAIQEAKQLAYTAQQEAEAKASREQVDALESMYQGMESARQQDMTNVSGDLNTALSRVTAIETNLGDQAQQINFMNTHIRMSNEGLILGDDQQGNYLLQQPHRLDFISNGTVVAYVSNNELWINSGIFTDRLKVGDINIVKQGTNRIRFE